MTFVQRNHRPLIMGRRGAVGSNHPMATQAGLDVLRAGGNAVDAAVAVSLALGVCEPMMSGLGGDGFYHLHLAKTGTSVVFNGTGAAPGAATAERFKDGVAVSGALSASIPGSLAGLAAMHAAHGELPFGVLVRPAIALAHGGFAVTHKHVSTTQDNRARLAADERSAASFLGQRLGDLCLQPDLGRTLEEIAADGAETFYRGPLAQRIAAGVAAAGGMITAGDLSSCSAEVQAPIGITYRGWTITQTGPNSTGFTMLQMLKIAERFDIAGMSAAERVHVLVEAKKLAFLDRERWGADPRYETVPLDRLLSDRYADELAGRIDMGRAAVMATPVSAAGDTTYFCVVDGEGNAVSAIQSLNGAYGSGVTAGDTGIVMNNRMAYWHVAEGHANRLVPGKRVRHTMNAPMVLKDGKLVAVLGTPGADHQVQVNLQVVTAMLDLGLDPQSALEMPRWTSSQVGQGANWPHEGDGALSIEVDHGEAVLADLAVRGHQIKPLGHLEGPCAMQAIRVLENGVRMAGSDPRRDGWAGAF